MSADRSHASSSPLSAKKKGKSLPPKFVIGLGKFVWTTMWRTMMANLAPSDKEGAYKRPSSQFRDAVGSEEGTFPPAEGRYRLYVGLSCPWAHRTLVVRTLKGLTETIPVTVAAADASAGGWALHEDEHGCRTLAELYQLAQPGYSGRCTVPVLWDRQAEAIVNNESADIIAILNSQFNEFARHPDFDLYPADLKDEIDRWNEIIYATVNNGVYRCGFAQSQAAYETACNELFDTLDEIESTLASHRYLCGDRLTLADVRLFTTLIRFDTVYHGLFKCNRQRIRDYRHLGGYLRELYQLPGIADTCDLEALKQEYYSTLFPLNPGGIVPSVPTRATCSNRTTAKVSVRKWLLVAKRFHGMCSSSSLLFRPLTPWQREFDGEIRKKRLRTALGVSPLGLSHRH